MGIPVPGGEETVWTPQHLLGDILPPVFSCADCKGHEEGMGQSLTKWQVLLQSLQLWGGFWRGLRMRLRGWLPILLGLLSHLTLCCWKMTTVKMTAKQLWCIGMRLVVESEPTSSTLVPGRSHILRINPRWMEGEAPGSSVGRREEHWACFQGDNHELPWSPCHGWVLHWAFCRHHLI